MVHCLGSLFGIDLSRGGSVHTVLRAASRCEPVYDCFRRSLGESAWAVPDETGWRVGARPAWLHTLVGPEVTAYVIYPTRSGAVAEAILGLDYDGTMVHDGWSPYDQFEDARHPQCLNHLLRRADEMAAAATRGAVCFPRRVAKLFRAGLDLRDRYAPGEISRHGLAVARGRLENQLSDLVFPPKTNGDNERLAQHLWTHRDDQFTFLRQPGLDAANWRAELAIHFGVILRKVWGGRRTWAETSPRSRLGLEVTESVGLIEVKAIGPGEPEPTPYEGSALLKAVSTGQIWEVVDGKARLLWSPNPLWLVTTDPLPVGVALASLAIGIFLALSKTKGGGQAVNRQESDDRRGQTKQ